MSDGYGVWLDIDRTDFDVSDNNAAPVTGDLRQQVEDILEDNLDLDRQQLGVVVPIVNAVVPLIESLLAAERERADAAESEIATLQGEIANVIGLLAEANDTQ